MAHQHFTLDEMVRNMQRAFQNRAATFDQFKCLLDWKAFFGIGKGRTPVLHSIEGLRGRKAGARAGRKPHSFRIAEVEGRGPCLFYKEFASDPTWFPVKKEPGGGMRYFDDGTGRKVLQTDPLGLQLLARSFPDLSALDFAELHTVEAQRQRHLDQRRPQS